MTDTADTWTVALKLDAKEFEDGLKAASTSGKQFNSALVNAFTGVALQGKGLSSVIDTLALSLSKIALKAAFQPLTSALGSAFGNLLSSPTSAAAFGFANGGAFERGMPVPFATGGVISSPVAFPMAGGQTGLAGENGAEAIMPLTRGADGKLGVRSDGGGGAASVTFNITTPDADSFRRTETQIAAMLARAVGQGQRNL